MSGMGTKFPKWNKELDNKFLAEIAKGSNNMQLSITMKMSYSTMAKRIKQMGFYNLTDARKVLAS